MYNNLETLIKALIEGLLRKDRLLVLHGPPNTGKSFVARVLAEVFGPFVNIDERQLGKDNLILDDVVAKQARCIWLEEMNFEFDFAPCLKRILSGYKQGARMSKQRRVAYDTYRCPLIILTTNRNPDTVCWLQEEGIKARTILVNWDKPLEYNNCFNIFEFITAGLDLKRQCIAQRVNRNTNAFINRELDDVFFTE